MRRILTDCLSPLTADDHVLKYNGRVNEDEKEEMLARLKEIIIDRLDVEEDQIVPEASFVEDLGADSLDIVELIMGIEEEFDIEIPTKTLKS